jgi:hypothetical protein
MVSPPPANVKPLQAATAWGDGVCAGVEVLEFEHACGAAPGRKGAWR